VKESRKIATFYQGKSVAEQNTVNLTWDLFARRQLQSPANRHFSTDVENAQFQYLVVNSVMSTDMMNPDLEAVRNARWEKAVTAFTADPIVQEDL
jgi:hypothetical protein